MRDQSRRPTWLANLAGRYKVLLAVLPLLTIFMLTSVATLISLGRESNAHNLAQHTYRVLLGINATSEQSQQAVINARGYLLSADPDELAAYASGKQRFAEQMENLRALAVGNAALQLQLGQVEELAVRWQREVDRAVVAPLRNPPGDPVAAALHRTQVGDNYRKTRTVRGADIAAKLQHMARSEQAVLAQRNEHSDAALAALRLLSVLAALFGLAFGGYVIWATSRLMTVPLRQITDMMNRVARHDTGVTVTRLIRADEIGELARALQVFKQMVIDINDQAWVKSQLAVVSQRLQEATSHREFGQVLTSQLAPLLHAGVCLYYLHDSHSGRLDLLGSYGLQQSWDTGTGLAPGEGLVGQCLLDRQPIELDNLPGHYVHVHSGSGEAAPSYLLVLPVIQRDVVSGVLEVASFGRLDAARRELLDALLPLIGLTQDNLTRAVNTQDLLERTRLQAEDLRVSELVMRQQKEVLHDSHAALEAKTDELQEQSEHLMASREKLREQTGQLQASNAKLLEQNEHMDRQHAVLEELQQETSEKADQLARASQYKSEFLANMSHELRTPLNSLLILSRNLADNSGGNLDAGQVESARIIHDAGSSLLALINDILDLSKIEAGRMEAVIDTLPLAEFAQRLRRSFAHVALDRKLDYSVAVAPGLPAILRTDGARLEQIANNLLSNAFKFTAHGSVSVEIAPAAMDAPDVPAELGGQPLLALSISDTGMGIPADKFRRIFNSFEQVDASTSRQFGGTGLGLAISRRLAHLLGGELGVHSEVGVGSRFVLWLPLTPPETAVTAALPASAESAAQGLLAAAVPTAPPPAPSGIAVVAPDARATLLVIEDDQPFARILASLVEQHGHRVLIAHDGKAGLQMASTERPDGILLDVTLPSMDGWSVLGALQAQPATRDIPVHFISASDDTKRAAAAGAVGFLVKPVTRESIAIVLERVLHATEARPQRVLIVDDSAADRLAIRTQLQHVGVEFDDAASAEDALAQVARTNYGCIVLDLGLPGMSGLDMLDQLATTAASVPPVVVYSGRDLSTGELARLKAHTSAIVSKSARVPDQLRDEVSRFLRSVVPATGNTSPTPNPGDRLRGHHALVVDDDMRNLFALTKVLRDWGMQVTMAQNGQKALDVLAEIPHIDLVLMDVMMPVMDGYTAMTAIRAQPAFATLPIIALTARAMNGDRERCVAAGASDYLSKPLDLDQLADVLGRWTPDRDAAESRDT